MSRLLPAALALLLPLGVFAQTSRFGLEYRPQAAGISNGAAELPLAWAGGLNSPQFSGIDLNADGQQDMFVFERMTNRVQTYLSVPAANGGRAWQYAPEYEGLFPGDLQNWALLRDYDCDNRPDLWTQIAGGDVRVFRNVPDAAGRPTFQLISNQLTYSLGSGTGSFNIRLGGYDVPAIQDVDGDGRLDILSFDFASGNYLQYFRNTSAGCGGLQFRQESDFWGGVTACFSSCTGYATGGVACRPNGTNHTGGSGVLLQDFDQDGDQDVLVGRDGCAELVGLRNTGTAQLAATNSGSVLTALPNGLGAVSLVNYPVAFSLDATHDGKPDLVVASALLDNTDRVSLRNNVQLFENTGTAAAPSYVRRPGGFVADQMLDVSEGAATTFADLDADGLVDMLVANHAEQYGAHHTETNYRATLSFYRNVGTRSRPVFSLANADYLGLAARNLRALRPALADLNRDGAPDLAFAATYQGASFVFYFLNTAAANQPAAFSTAQLTYLRNLGNTAGDTPCFTDVDGDGHLDLLLGTNSINTAGSLLYYRRNPAQPLENGFSLVSDDYGRIRMGNGDRPFTLAPTVTDADGDGTPDLLTLDHSGVLRMYANYRAQSGTFVERTDLVLNNRTGQYEATRLGANSRARNHVVAADLSNDGAPEVVVGLETGGLLLYGTRNRVTSTRNQAAALALQLYPNPAATEVLVETAAPTRVVIRDLRGRLVLQATPLARRHQLNVQALAAGTYLLEATDAQGRRGGQLLVVGR
ncbi:T9SS type A sorting domain-containing protein [Hymenobacter latericus]|uniref:T9SS type A sorting domain-containing protein n=1 Tax=Hymenobacter sp. YIM 151858-1 TaxID=2987688 RepID=UPI0022265D1F|nr:T9SS type A sorting domain-containing protein [Hymenobacter sp. YIM 151858-1]UYZ57879.1 T9SS type A sorting domain-containing protein [Hymenobacter sp. YIM 151858-1]